MTFNKKLNSVVMASMSKSGVGIGYNLWKKKIIAIENEYFYENEI